MSRDPLAEGRRWLAQAESDVADARLLAEHGRNAAACFLSQQATEKALKAVLYAAGADAVHGHSIGDLCPEVAALAPEAAGCCEEWAVLDQYYIPTRYPDALPGGIPATAYTAAQAAGAIGTAAAGAPLAAAPLD